MKFKYTRKEIAESFDECFPRANDHDMIPDLFYHLLLEPADWPQEGDKFWCVLSTGEVESSIFDRCPSDKIRKDFGNCFKTKKEAIKARDKIKSLLNK